MTMTDEERFTPKQALQMANMACILALIAVMMSGYVLLQPKSKAEPDQWIYSSYQGYQFRTNKETGERYISRGDGWEKTS